MLLNSERMKKLLGDGNEDLEITREVLNDKISELNSAIDGVSAQLQVSEEREKREERATSPRLRHPFLLLPTFLSLSL